MSGALTEIFRSPRRADCEERAFVLSAVGIATALDIDGADFILQADSADAARALVHLEQYEHESRSAPPRPPPPRLHANAWVGSLIYAVVLFGVAYAVSGGYWRLDAFDVGELDAERVKAGEWWRAWTALTLHVDGPHLAANTGAGVWFGYLASQLIGVGNAWFLVVCGAGAANWIEAQFGPSTHRAVGASTAVFAALALLSAYSWRTRFRRSQRWASRWAPLVAGVVLLGWTGTAGEGTDIVAHALGFAMGALLGVAVAEPRIGRALDRVPQWLTGLAALVPLVVAWARALAS